MIKCANNPRILVLLLGLFFCLSVQFTSAEDIDKWEVEFSSETRSIKLAVPEDIKLYIYNLNETRLTESNAIIRVVSTDPGVVEISKQISIDEIQEGRWTGTFKAVPVTLGKANVSVEIACHREKLCSIIEVSSESMQITVLRNHNMIDINRWFSPQFSFYFMHIFFVLGNAAFGVALDLKKLKSIAQYPIGPCVTFLFDLILFPVSCFVIGLIIFPDYLGNRISLIAAAITTMGTVSAASSWTVLFGGNISLAQMNGFTTNILSCGVGFSFKLLMQSIYNVEIQDPHHQFIWDTYLFILPLIAGLIIQFVFPRSAQFFMKTLVIWSLMVVPYEIFKQMNFQLDLFVYRLFTWESLLVGILLPPLVYGIVWLVTFALKIKYNDSIAICTNVALKNMYLATHVIFLVSQKPGDFADLFPGAVVFSTSLMLTIHLLWNTFKKKCTQTTKCHSFRCKCVLTPKGFGHLIK